MTYSAHNPSLTEHAQQPASAALTRHLMSSAIGSELFAHSFNLLTVRNPASRYKSDYRWKINVGPRVLALKNHVICPVHNAGRYLADNTLHFRDRSGR